MPLINTEETDSKKNRHDYASYTPISPSGSAGHSAKRTRMDFEPPAERRRRRMSSASGDGGFSPRGGGVARPNSLDSCALSERPPTPQAGKNYETNETVIVAGGVIHHGTEFDIPEDAYGAALLCIVKEFAEINAGLSVGLCVMRCVFALMLLVLNAIFQGFVLYMIGTFVVEPSVHHVQTLFKDFHAMVFDEHGVFQQDAWDEYEGRGEICATAVSNRSFYYPLLILWTISMLTELRNSQRLIQNILLMPSCDTSEEMMLVDEQVMRVIGLTLRARWAIILGICVPKVVLCVCLFELGLRWLTATTSFQDLLLNAVAMEFVLKIDEMLYEFAMPKAYRALVSATDFFFEIPESSPSFSEQLSDDARKHVRWQWNAYYRSIFYVICSLAIPLVYGELVQDVLPPGLDGIYTHCRAYLSHKNVAICKRDWTTWRIPFAECFPYGA